MVMFFAETSTQIFANMLKSKDIEKDNEERESARRKTFPESRKEGRASGTVDSGWLLPYL